MSFAQSRDDSSFGKRESETFTIEKGGERIEKVNSERKVGGAASTKAGRKRFLSF